MLTFRNTLSVPPSYTGRCEEWLGLRNVGVYFSELVIHHNYLYMKVEQSVTKRRHIKFRRGGIIQTKAHNIQNRAKVWNQESESCSHSSYIDMCKIISYFMTDTYSDHMFRLVNKHFEVRQSIHCKYKHTEHGLLEYYLPNYNVFVIQIKKR
jgi:hypothetical protein